PLGSRLRIRGGRGPGLRPGRRGLAGRRLAQRHLDLHVEAPPEVFGARLRRVDLGGLRLRRRAGPGRGGPQRGHGRRRSRPRARAGIERKTPLPSGQPGMTPPDIHGIVIPSVPGRAILDRPVVVTPDHRIVDEEGREIPIQEIINQPGGIHPRRPGEEIPGEDAEKQDGKKRNGKGPSKGPVPPAGKRP
ncbi:MAG: hypothetical protein ACE5ID_11150, partial [Acidobacteriota bacterium]